MTKRIQLSRGDRAKLKHLRLENGWSHREMADRIGLPESTMKSVLEDERELRETTAFRVLQWLESWKKSAVAS
jgi:transcriptional regulator with XRE-family HTH domain